MKPVEDIEYRGNYPAEELKIMIAWEGNCKYCGDRGLVKMHRDPSDWHTLQPDNCYCYTCGQHYYMDIKDLKSFEEEQWEQKEKERP